MTSAAFELIGREPELGSLHAFFDAEPPPATFVLTGVAGVGKTALWEAGVESARAAGFRILLARPSGAETKLSFAALADLCDDVDTTSVRNVPTPQVRALEVALLRADPGAETPEPFAISTGFTNTLRALSGEQPLLIAVDDVQWLDSASAAVLVFAARRLRGYPVRFLLARRADDSSSLEDALEPLGVARHDVGPLSFGAARSLLSARLGLAPPRPVLRRVFDTSGGNPLFMLELGRMLISRGMPDDTAELPLPRVVDDLFGARLAGASPRVRRLVRGVALAGTLTRAQLMSLEDDAAIDEALETGLLVTDRDRIRVSHPLLAATATATATQHERRELHAELAHAVGDDLLRARHLALATTGPDDELALMLSAAAERAMARGAAQDAVELAEHALRLTEPGADDLIDRTLELAEYLEVFGDDSRIKELLEPHLRAIPSGPSRARAHLRLAATAYPDAEAREYHLDRALKESADDPALRARALEGRAILLAGVQVARFEEAEAAVREALPFAEESGDEVEGLVLHTLAWIGMLRGRPIDAFLERLGKLRLTPIHESDVDHLVAQELLFRGEVDRARSAFRRVMATSDQRGEGRYARVHYQLCGLEVRAGNTAAAAQLLAELDESAGYRHTDATRDRFRALLAATCGLVEAEEISTAAIEACTSAGYAWGRLDAVRARGLARLAAADPRGAVEDLRDVWEHTLREGIDNPGVFPVAPDLVEALTAYHQTAEAEDVAGRLRELAGAQHHPWGMPSAARCQALIELGRTRDDDVLESLVEAVAAYRKLGLHFDAARTLFGIGRAARRLKKWRTARSSLEDAVRAFEKIGAVGWADQARAELARVGARRGRPSGGGLTAAEQQVIRLAADGLSNKEIAQALHVTVSTVEAHLKHAYAKLGVHSRAKATAEAARLGLLGQ